MLEMTMRSVLVSFLIGTMLTLAATSPGVADPSTFEIMGLKLGMTASQIETAAEEAGFAVAGRDPGPSFEQVVAQKRGQRVSGAAYTAVNKINLVRDDAHIEVFFVPTAEGSRAYQIAANILNVRNGTDLTDDIIARYGQPEQRGQREWLWGDTDMFYARTKPYLEFQPNPVSATAPKPVARLILADPALQKRSRKAIASEAGKGS
jgi:hypothetical protein